MAMMMMVVVPPPMLLEVVIVVMMMVMMMEAVSRGRLDGAGERAGGDENGDEA